MEHTISTRERILFAAQRVIQEKGLARTTVREIAAAANLSEGALYKHFRGKTDIFLSMLRHAPTDYFEFMAALPKRAGKGTLEQNLTEFVRRSLEFHSLTIPLAGSLFAEPELLTEYQVVLKENRAGPHKGVGLLARYLVEEQALGRVSADTPTEAVASMLAGACFHHIFIDHFEGREIAKRGGEAFVEALVAAAMKSLR